MSETMSEKLNEDEHVLCELMAREPIFHRPEWSTARADDERMTAPDYWEVGASGKVYLRDHVLALLEHRRLAGLPDEMLEPTGFACRRLGPDCWLLTYHLVQGDARRTRRATIWERAGNQWRIVYHQGTLSAE